MSVPEFLSKYDYTLPDDLIAREPAHPRDSARLFVYDTVVDRVTFSTFRQLPTFLRTPSLLVLNNTKVIPARITLYKSTGGKVEVLLLLNEPHENFIRALFDRRVNISESLTLGTKATFTVVGQEANIFLLKSSVSEKVLMQLLVKEGRTPVPKYLGSKLSESVLRFKYQSVFAETPASVAAPTASLHFTPELLEDLLQKGIEQTHVTLHVGLGTFAPVTEEQMAQGQLHSEMYEISPDSAVAIVQAKKNNHPIVAVGTTVVRALESSATKLLGGNPASGETNLFIRPPFDFRIVDALITNFHLPRSSLMCLVDAFLKHKHAKRSILELYDIAIKEKFRFYSFGDAMLIM